MAIFDAHSTPRLDAHPSSERVGPDGQVGPSPDRCQVSPCGAATQTATLGDLRPRDTLLTLAVVVGVRLMSRFLGGGEEVVDNLEL
jgi:hypothetical protein